MNYPFLQRHDNGKFWPAGHDIFGLCAAWNHATNPSLPMTDREYRRSSQYARAVKNRMARLGFSLGRDWIELSDGQLMPRPTGRGIGGN